MRYISAILFGLCLCLGTHSASSQILFAGGEDVSFNKIGTTATNSGAGFRTAFARGAVVVSNSNSTTDPPANRLQTPTFTATGGATQLWIHAQVDSGPGGSSTLNEQSLLIRSPDGVSRLLLRQTGMAGQFKASTRTAAGVITDLATATTNLTVGTLQALDIKIIYGCTTTDVFQVFIAGTSAINYTGASICTDTATTLNQLELMGISNGNGTTCIVSGDGTCWSEVIVAQQDTRSMGLWTLPPQTAGNTQSWTPNTVGNVNPFAINDANFISTTTSNALSQWTTPVTPPSGIWGVLAVVQEARVAISTTGPQHFEWLCRSGATDNVIGSLSPTTSFSNFANQIWANNCKTGVAWSISDIAAGFNLGIESLP